MKEDSNRAISDGDRLSTGDELDGMCEYLQSQYVLDGFFSVSGGKLFNPDSGIREGIGFEVGELESWISDDGASRHKTSSHDSMINYRECSGIVKTAGGDVLPIEGVGGILLRFLFDSEAYDIQLLNVAFVPHYSSLQPPTIHASVRKMVWSYSSSQVECYKLESSAGRMCAWVPYDPE